MKLLLSIFGFHEESRSAAATIKQAPARNAPLIIVGMTMAAHGAMENASGGTMNVPRHTQVKRAIVQGRELMANGYHNFRMLD